MFRVFVLALLVALPGAAAIRFVTMDVGGDTCAAPGAIACVPVGPEERFVRLRAENAAYVIEDAAGAPLTSGMLTGDLFLALPPGAARVLVRAA